MPAVTWIQIEKLGLAYIKKPSVASAESLDKVLKRSADFLEKLARFFVRTQQKLEDVTLEFKLSSNGEYAGGACVFDPEARKFVINVIEVLKFDEFCQNAPALIETPEGRGNGNFSVYRLNAYKAELRKLPKQLKMLLLLFQEIARVLEVTYVDRKRISQKHELPKEDLDYLNLVWAFLHLENVYKVMNGSNLRIDFKFTWFESEWATEKK